MNGYKRYWLGILLSGALCCLPPVAQAQQSRRDWPGEREEMAVPSLVDELQDAFVKVARQIRPSVVTIYVERGHNTPLQPELARGGDQKSQFNLEDEEASIGSGMVLDGEGHILTNYHVIKNAAAIRVVSSDNANQRPLAKLIGFDEESDLAVLQIPPNPQFQPVHFGDSSLVRIGEWVMAVGAPFDQAQTVTTGVVSAKGRHLTRDGQLSLQDYLQTDASINPGNSGGPLLDLQGQVIGINTAILSPARYSVGIGFAVPSNTIKRLLPLLLQGERVPRGFLGIRYLPLAPGVAEAFGIDGGMQVGALAEKDSQPYGPAYEAGVRRGDIILAINGQQVTTREDFRRFIASLAPGTVVQLDVLRPLTRGFQKRTFEITLGDRTAPAVPQQVAPHSMVNAPNLGIDVQNRRELTAAQLTLLGQPPASLSETSSEVIITDVQPGSPADEADLQTGLVIERMNIMRRAVTGDEALGTWVDVTARPQFLAAIADLPAQSRVLLQLRDKQGVLLYKLIVTAQHVP